jgi:hypothetical protein
MRALIVNKNILIRCIMNSTPLRLLPGFLLPARHVLGVKPHQPSFKIHFEATPMHENGRSEYPTVLVVHLSLVSTAGAYCTPATAVSQRTD